MNTSYAMPPKPIYLIGFMGAGKTTLGHALGEADTPPGYSFIDLDEHIERQLGMSIPEIFATKGEAYFRTIETDTLAEVARLGRVIIGCGGGTPCHGNNMALMNSTGITIWLRASHSVLLRRLIEGQNQRPLLNRLTGEEISQLIMRMCALRNPHYSKAQLQFCADHLENEAEIAEAVTTFNTMLGNHLTTHCRI